MAITKVYTKTGDEGMTSLVGGVRVRKTNPRIEAYGTVDELSAQLGLLASFMKDGDDKNMVISIQRTLFTVCSYLATDTTQTKLAPSYTIDPQEVTVLEEEIDHLNGSLPRQTSFIIPAVLAMIGWAIYKYTDYKTTQDVYQQALKYSHEIGYVLLALAVVVVAFLAYKGLKKKK